MSQIRLSEFIILSQPLVDYVSLGSLRKHAPVSHLESQGSKFNAGVNELTKLIVLFRKISVT